MRFLLYNVRYCVGTGRYFHFPFPGRGYLNASARNLARITDFIKTSRPDIVGLVEVDSGSLRSGRKNQVESIASELGHYHVYESKYGEDSLVNWLPVARKQGNAFLTSDVVEAQRFHYFEHGVKKLVIELELSNLVLFLVHLSLKFRHRHHQMSELYELVKETKKPHIVAGDFNAYWGDQEIQLFLEATRLQSANTGGMPSYPSKAPRRQLDFVLHSREIEITHFEMPQVSYSDHLPLICDFEIRG